MESQVKKRLILRPLVIGICGAICGLALIFTLEALFSNLLQTMSKTDQQIHLPIALFFFFPFIFAVPALKTLFSNALILKKWASGINPSCPECNYPMVKRIAKKGRFVGQSFWGCYRYPKCSAKIHIG